MTDHEALIQKLRAAATEQFRWRGDYGLTPEQVARAVEAMRAEFAHQWQHTMSGVQAWQAIRDAFMRALADKEGT
jgi:hypothetical protein